MNTMTVIHYRDDVHDTSAICKTATVTEEWTTDPAKVTCLLCIAVEIEKAERALS